MRVSTERLSNLKENLGRVYEALLCDPPSRSGSAASAPLPLVPLKGPSVLLAGRPSVYGMSQLLLLANEM